MLALRNRIRHTPNRYVALAGTLSTSVRRSALPDLWGQWYQWGVHYHMAKTAKSLGRTVQCSTVQQDGDLVWIAKPSI